MMFRTTPDGSISRSCLGRAKKENLIRLANFMKLPINEAWSQKHIANLIWWKIKPKNTES